jgi:hypothetical protein
MWGMIFDEDPVEFLTVGSYLSFHMHPGRQWTCTRTVPEIFSPSSLPLGSSCLLPQYLGTLTTQAEPN